MIRSAEGRYRKLAGKRRDRGIGRTGVSQQDLNGRHARAPRLPNRVVALLVVLASLGLTIDMWAHPDNIY
jgi:hypothetical protein